MKIAILGAGGLGKAAAQIIEQKNEMTLVAVADAGGYVFNADGIVGAAKLRALKLAAAWRTLTGGVATNDSIGEIIKLGAEFDGVFLALPNLPNDFIPGITRRFLEGGFKGCFVDALKRTRAMEMMFELDGAVKDAGCVYLTGCGATPGLADGGGGSGGAIVCRSRRRGHLVGRRHSVLGRLQSHDSRRHRAFAGLGRGKSQSAFR